ncbi:competence type IV pilus minor pilin ComGF [Lysinibacillus odysseyi]|uniref:Competence protein ComGF n=1 Tax=Lysinibacillus odysseyi 34hs-1 = NBRC 100172 TaxID=1220589 RepID=A0A0A3IA26_9BACI|nr:competence type IV pilus minor pilin ComGF [Lysinibacillus odysseyi]KGR81589.1 hypothetical protein CD32_19740 [Lysinibacillus odysseyi 34hs-1 = NBRC 100172]
MIEALLQLILLIVFSHLLYLILMQYHKMTDIKNVRLEADWELCVNDINQYLPYGISQVAVSEDGLIATVTTPDKVYTIQFLNNVIWKRENNGNETILTGVTSALFTLYGNRLLLQVKLEDGVERERSFVVEPYSE